MRKMKHFTFINFKKLAKGYGESDDLTFITVDF